ncbi:hypothetical protein GJAV_G00130330 [Gymnothorax javanicus]|nr:hypothetical protein GJAV_G00130330 [Gymnothorax javanicus]
MALVALKLRGKRGDNRDLKHRLLEILRYFAERVGISMESADKNDEQMNIEQPEASQSSQPLESTNERQDTSPSQASGDVQSSSLNLYAALGLSPEDVDALAQIPESEMSVETLPHLIMQLKAKKAPSSEQTVASPPKGDAKNDQEDKQTDGTDGVPQQSTSKPPVHSQSADGSNNKTVSQERSGSVRSRKEPRHYKSSAEGSPPKFPLSTQMDDFHGVMPWSFPHTCSLCYCILYSTATWNDHLNGSRHEESRRKFFRTHPELDLRDAPGRERDGGDGPVRRDSRSSSSRKRPYPMDFGPGERHFHPTDRHMHLKPKAGTKVVVAKFVRGSVCVEDLLTLAKPFGTVVKHLIFPVKGFLEFSSHKEAVDMVTHYASKPAYVKDTKLALYLSPVVGSIHTPRLDRLDRPPKRPSHAVVCFSHLPPDKDSESELLEVAKMFGEVRNSKAYDNEVFIEMEDWNDAEIMVKYYHSNSLKIFGKNVRVGMSSHKLPRSSPDPLRKGDSSRSLSKGKEASKSSHLKDKEKTSSQKDVTEKKNEQLKATDELVEIGLGSEEEDEQGTKVEDEPANTKEESGKADAADESVVEEPSGPTNASKKEESEGSGVEMDQNLGTTPAEEQPEKSEENLGEVAPSPAPAEEPSAGEDSADTTMESKDMEDYPDEDEDFDFPDNMDDFVTLDELDNDAGESIDSNDDSEGGKVVAVRRIRKGSGLVRSLLNLAEPFGGVRNHSINFYRQEALLELESHEAARKMIKFYQGSRKALIFGRPVYISMCRTLQELEDPSGKSIYISMLPLQKYSDISLLRLAQPYGKVTAYHLNWRQRKCYIQMDTVEAAQKMIDKYLLRPPKFYGAVIRICACKKGDSQIPWRLPVKYNMWCEQQKIRQAERDKQAEEAKAKMEAEAKTENGQSGESSSAKKTATEDGGQSSISDGEGATSAADKTAGQTGDKEEEEEEKSSPVQGPLGPYQPNNPVGVDYIVQRTGFFCKLCKVFYTNEKTAKSLHCSSLAHYQKLKMKLDDQPSE